VEGVDFGSPVHAGFAGLFEQLWPGVQEALDKLVVGADPAATQASNELMSLGLFFAHYWSLVVKGGKRRAVLSGNSIAHMSHPHPLPLCRS